MKILVLCYEYPPVGGGGGRMAHNVAAALVCRGHQVRVQTVRMPDLPAREVRNGVEIFRTSGFRRRAELCTVPEMAGYLVSSFLPSLRHIREWKPDIVHAHFAVPTGALALACSLLTGVPYVLTAHLGDLPGGNPDQTSGLFRFLDPFIRPIWKKAAGISASSSFAAGLAREAYGVEPRIILNGISMEGKAAAASQPASPMELVAIGRFNPQKNFPWMLRALGGCDFPWRLSLIGDGSQRGEIEAAIRDAGIGDRVALMGWVTENAMRDVLARSDVLLMPSTSEGNPVAAIEALKHGVAILGSDIGGLSDLIENGTNGFAVPLATPAVFQDNLAWLANHPDSLYKMKTQSLLAADRFDLNKISAAFESLLLTGRPGRSKLLSLLPLLLSAFLLSGCVNLIDPLGPVGKGPVPRPARSNPHPGDKFAWGISSASYQYEDPAVKPGQKDGFSTDWDILVSQHKAPEKGNALYSWTRFEKDLDALKKIGVTHYRFSIEWARVEPKPGVYDEEAIRRYVGMARRLKEAGIEPVICLWHFTFPAWLYDNKNPGQSNWLHPLARERWNAYVNKIVRATAPYTNYYAPQNEPNGQITTAYIVAQWPPCMTLAFGHYWKAIDASAGMFRDAAARIKKIKPAAKVVSVEALPWWQRAPLDPGGLIYNTMIHGNVDHLDRVYDVCDIVGFNYYYSQAPGPISLLSENARRGHNFTMMGWRIDPDGLYKEIRRVGDRYGKPMMITENGIATKNDSKRVWYMRNHLAAIGRAIRDGYDMRGYFTWSLADNYEWHFGYKAFFGLSTMDPKTYDRVFKPSAGKYSEIIKSHPTVKSVTAIGPKANFK